MLRIYDNTSRIPDSSIAAEDDLLARALGRAQLHAFRLERRLRTLTPREHIARLAWVKRVNESLGGLAVVLAVACALVTGCTAELGRPDPTASSDARIVSIDGHCSGIAIAADTIATARHCLLGLSGDEWLATAPYVLTHDGRALRVTGVKRHAAADLAAVFVAPELEHIAELGSPELGAATLTGYGCSGGSEQRSTPADLVRVAANGEMVLGAIVCGGDSGGAVLQADKLVGVIITTAPEVPSGSAAGVEWFSSAFVLPLVPRRLRRRLQAEATGFAWAAIFLRVIVGNALSRRRGR